MRAESYKHDPEAACAAIRERQFGLIEREQALGAGMSPAAIKYRLRTGRWTQILPRVYLVAGAAVTWVTRAMAAVLWGGIGQAVLSHRAAARCWGFPGFEDARVEISTRTRRVSKDFVVHHSPDLLRHEMTASKEGLPLTTVHRTLIDIGDVCPLDMVEDALDHAMRRGLTSPAYLLKQIDRIGTQGRRGAALLKTLLTGDTIRPSWLERRFIRRISRTELPPLEREHPVLRYRIDFAWPGVRRGVEIHSEKFHRNRAKWNQDLARHNEITSAGWTVLYFTWSQIRDEPAVVIAEIVATYRRLAGLQI